MSHDHVTKTTHDRAPAVNQIKLVVPVLRRQRHHYLSTCRTDVSDCRDLWPCTEIARTWLRVMWPILWQILKGIR